MDSILSTMINYIYNYIETLEWVISDISSHLHIVSFNRTMSHIHSPNSLQQTLHILSSNRSPGRVVGGRAPGGLGESWNP